MMGEGELIIDGATLERLKKLRAQRHRVLLDSGSDEVGDWMYQLESLNAEIAELVSFQMGCR